MPTHHNLPALAAMPSRARRGHGAGRAKLPRADRRPSLLRRLSWALAPSPGDRYRVRH